MLVLGLLGEKSLNLYSHFINFLIGLVFSAAFWHNQPGENYLCFLIHQPDWDITVWWRRCQDCQQTHGESSAEECKDAFPCWFCHWWQVWWKCQCKLCTSTQCYYIIIFIYYFIFYFCNMYLLLFFLSIICFIFCYRKLYFFRKCPLCIQYINHIPISSIFWVLTLVCHAQLHLHMVFKFSSYAIQSFSVYSHDFYVVW